MPDMMTLEEALAQYAPGDEVASPQFGTPARVAMVTEEFVRVRADGDPDEHNWSPVHVRKGAGPVLLCYADGTWLTVMGHRGGRAADEWHGRAPGLLQQGDALSLDVAAADTALAAGGWQRTGPWTGGTQSFAGTWTAAVEKASQEATVTGAATSPAVTRMLARFRAGTTGVDLSRVKAVESGGFSVEIPCEQWDIDYLVFEETGPGNWDWAIQDEYEYHAHGYGEPTWLMADMVRGHLGAGRLPGEVI